MMGLLVKDLCLLKEQRQTAILLVMWLLMVVFDASFFGDPSFMLGFLSFLGAIIAISTISYDEYDNGYPFLFTLPVRRRTYAAEKYVFSIFLMSVFWGVGMIVGLIKGSMGLGGITVEEIAAGAWMLLYVYVLIALMIPIYLKFGGEKARVVIILFVLALFAIIGGLFNVMSVDGGVPGTMTWLLEQSQAVLLGTGLVISVVLLLVSYGVSVRILRKKEF